MCMKHIHRYPQGHWQMEGLGKLGGECWVITVRPLNTVGGNVLLLSSVTLAIPRRERQTKGKKLEDLLTFSVKQVWARI